MNGLRMDPANGAPNPAPQNIPGTTLCRALYDYQTQGTSTHSFLQGEIIGVLVQLESGWWDGLLRDQRGWFPSNYVVALTGAEANAALLGSQS
jgi:son of sevenless